MAAGFDVAAEQFFRERIFEKTFHRTTHWSGAVLGIISFVDEKFLRALLKLDVNVLGFDAHEHFVDFQINDAQQLRLAERMKHDDLVQPVRNSGLKTRFVSSRILSRIEL